MKAANSLSVCFVLEIKELRKYLVGFLHNLSEALFFG